MDRVKNHLNIGKIADILIENRRISDKIEHRDNSRVRRKMLGYIAEISCIGRGRHDIFWRKIGGEKFLQKLPKKSLIYQLQAINRQYNGKKRPKMMKIADISAIFWSINVLQCTLKISFFCDVEGI